MIYIILSKHQENIYGLKVLQTPHVIRKFQHIKVKTKIGNSITFLRITCKLNLI